MDLTIYELFDTDRYPSFIYCIPIVFYFPFGCCLAFIRFFIGIQALLLSVLLCKWPKIRCFFLRIMCTVLGFVVFIKNFKNYDDDTRIFVSNHITNFDHMALNLCIPMAVPSVWDLPTYLNWLLGYTNFDAAEGRQIFIKNIRNFIKESNSKLLIFPEGATTNGRKGLLKFNPWPFVLNHDVQPVTLKVSRPFITRLSPSILGSRWWSDFFWFLFVPYTVFTFRFLPVVPAANFENAEQFCKTVEKMICKDLGLKETNFTSSDKVQCAKSLLQSR